MIPGWDLVVVGMNPYCIFEGEGFRTRSGHLIEEYLSLRDRGTLYYAYPEGGATPFLHKGDGLYLVDLSSYSLHRLLEERRLKKVIFWLYHPLLLEEIPHRGLLVFDGVDNWIKHPSFSSCQKQLKKAYRRIGERAHIIFTVSKELKELFRGRGEVYQVRNGVPRSFLTLNPNPPPMIRGLEPPIIGYVGVMEGRFDVELLKDLARSLEGGTILLVGPIWGGLKSSLKGVERICTWGFHPYQQIPPIIASFQVAIIPHLVNDFTKSMDPLKLYEYLALGCPVVTTAVAGVEEFSSVIKIAADREDFIEKVKEYLADPGSSVCRKKMVENETWRERIKEMQRILRAYLKKGFIQ